MPWVLLSLVFIFPPLAVVLFLSSKRYSLTKKAMAGAFVLFVAYTFRGSEKILLEYQQNLWVHKFFEARTQFRYRDAEIFLRRIPLISNEDQLGLNLLSMGHLLSLGETDRVLQLYDETLRLFFSQIEILDPKFKQVDSQDLTFKAIFETYLLKKDLQESPISDKPEMNDSRLKDAVDLYSELIDGGISGGMTGLLEYAFFLKQDEKDSRRLLTCAIQLFFMVPERMRGSVFNLEFHLLAYLINFGSKEDLEQAEKNWKRSLDTELSEFVNQSPYNLKAYNLRGILRAKRGDWQGAFQDWMHVFKVDVSHFSVYENLTRALVALSRSGQGRFLEEYKEAENIRFSEAGFEKALNLFGGLLEASGEVPEMLRDEVYFNMGVIYRNNTLELDKAIQTFEQILSMPESFRREMALFNLAMCHFQLGHYERCQETIKKLIQEFPTSDQIGKLKLILINAKSLEIIREIRDRIIGVDRP